MKSESDLSRDDEDWLEEQRMVSEGCPNCQETDNDSCGKSKAYAAIILRLSDYWRRLAS